MLASRSAEQIPQIYHITFETVNKSDLLPFENIETMFSEVTKWLDDCSIYIPDSWRGKWPGDIEKPIKNQGGKFQFLQDPVGDNPSRIALRVTRPKSEPLPHFEVIDYLISPGESADGNKWRLSVALRVGGASRPLLTQEAAPEPPSVVTKFLEIHTCFDSGVKMHFGPKNVSIADCIDLFDTVNDDTRELPAVVLVKMRDDDNLATQIGGLAHVFCVDNAQLLADFHDELLASDFSRHATWDLLGAPKNTVGKLYWPVKSSNDGVHRTNLPLNQLQNAVAAFSLQCRRQHEQSWEFLERQKFVRRIKKSTKPEERGRIEDLQRQLTKVKKDCERADSAKDKLALKLRSERLLKARLLRTNSLCEGLGRKGLTRSLDEMTIETVQEAIEAAKKDFPGRVLFDHIKMEDILFQRAGELYLAFKWLANDYLRARKESAQGCIDLIKSCKNACGFDYAGGQSISTMGMYPEDYEFTYRDRKVKAAEHLRWGVAHNPQQTLRMSFHYDEELAKVVIYYFGKHQRNQIT